MPKKTTFFVVLALFITLIVAVSSYFFKDDEKKQIININRNLARNVKIKGLPASAGAIAAKQVSIKSAAKKSKITLSQEKLESLRRFHSQNQRPRSLTDLPKERSIILANRTIEVPENAELPTSLSRDQIPTSRSTLPYIIHFGQPVTKEMRKRVENSGAILCGYLPNYAFLAEVTNESLQILADDSEINYITEYTVDDKIQPFLAALIKTENPNDTIQVSIQTLDGKDIKTVVNYLKQNGRTVENVKQLPEWGVVDAIVPLNDMAALAEMGEVQWIEERADVQLLNDFAANTNHINAISSWNDWYLTGEDQIVGHADTGVDTGDKSSIHPDFTGRIEALFDLANGGSDAADYDGHGTHTAASICGNGTASGGQYKGIAHKARLISQCVVDHATGDFTGINDLFGLYEQSHEAGASIHSDSWGATSYGYYDSLSRTTDLFAWTYPDFIAVFAAGNSGMDGNGDGIIDLNGLNSPGTAKNVLTVGATENDRTAIPEGYRGYTYGTAWPSSYGTNPIKDDWISWSATTSPYQQGMAAFSSRGPTADNRIKPDICTPGTDVISLRSTMSEAGYGWGILPSDNNYCYNGGTSMSTPLAAGSLALLRQYIVERAGIAQPSSALLKAAIIGGSRSLAPGQYGTDSTQEIPFTSPNNVEGWGQPDLAQTVHPDDMMIKLIDNISLETGETNTFEITVEKNGYPFDAVLCWVDYPATAGASVTLINDLNLNVVTPGTNTLYPNSGIADDDRNTVESVRVNASTTGVYKINVIGENVPQSGGTAALYIRGAFEEKPVIVHQATPFYNYNLAPYPVNFKVQSLNTLTNSELTLFYNTGTTGAVTGEWHTAATEWTSNTNYRAFIPQAPANTILHYYIQFTNNLYAVELPNNATASNLFFTIQLGEPVTLVVDGSEEQYGTVSPEYGTNTMLSGETFTASAQAQTVSSTERLTAYNWNGTGDIPADGTQNPFNATLSQNSTLTWNWQTQYKLTRDMYFKNLGATITDSSEWHWKDIVIPDQATYDLLNINTGYDEYLYAFYGWSLNGSRWPDETSPSLNPLSGLVMSNAFTLQADYMEFNSDADGDSLYDWWEMKYFGQTAATDNTDDDPDNDLWTNLSESLDNTNPLDPSSVPTPPVITVNTLYPFQTARPPWMVTADVTDNFMVMGVVLEWKEKDDSVWNQVEMEYLNGNTYTAEIDPPSHGSVRVDYRVTAYDLIGYYDSSFSSISPEYSVMGDYESPWMEVSPLTLGTAELTSESTNYTINVSNLAGPDLNWTGVLVSAVQTFDVFAPGWLHSGDNDVWNISTDRTWNGEPVWYCGDADSRVYPNACHASLDTPEFTVGKNGTLVFRHWMDFEEYGSSKPDYYWDGAIIMISTNSGSSFIPLEPVGGYNGLIEPNPDSPFPGDMPCFGDTGSGWQTVLADLSEFSGKSAVIRFQFGSDLYTVDEGWYIGNVTVLSSDTTEPAWLTKSGSWNGVLPDTWSDQFGFSVNPLLIDTNSEHVICIRIDSNDTEPEPIVDLTVRRGFAVTAESTGYGSVSINDPFIFRDETSVVNIQADHGSYITNVTINGIFQPGDYDSQDTYHNYTLQPVTNDLHFTADFALRSWDLIINSAYGDPSPAAGYYYITHGTAINASVITPATDADPMIRYSADSITLDGVDPVSEAAGEVSFVLTNHATLTWQWTTNYQFRAISTGNGVIVPDNAWFAAGSTGSTTGYPANYYTFSSWGGETNEAVIRNSVIDMPMTEPREITASFEARLTPTHGVPEYWLASYGFSGNFENAAENDQDGDNMATWKEWRADTDPTDSGSLLQISSVIRESNHIQLQWIGGIMRTQTLQKASELAGPWTDLLTNMPPTAVTNSQLLPDTNNSSFYRVIVP
ncbi:MAG: S8 family serine peptidase [Kiritimatiellia bacterium]